ncbi:MAG: outer membrane lipoprotein carrier protein LolA [Bacteroidales bacterium]|nr:outer membrane lipoprotein carrier protein LolA [Bacteroidales bacterium]
MQKCFLCAVALLMVAFGSAQQLKKASAEQAKTMLETVNKAAASVKTMQCDFTQTRKSSMLKNEAVSKGKMYYSGKKLKWAYTTPNKYAMVVVDNGKSQEVFLQSKDGSKTMDGQGSQLFKSIARLVMNGVTGAALSENSEFTVEMYTQGDVWVAKLTPKKDKMKKMFAYMRLYISTDRKYVNKVELYEANDDVTTIVFTNMKLNEKIDESVFAL